MTTETAPATTTVEHGTFTLERTYPFDRSTVFAAWATQSAKQVWFGEQLDFLKTLTRYELDFRVGGREVLEGRLASGKAFALEAIHFDIVDGRRIVDAYDVRIEGRRISVSLLTVEFHGTAGGTRLVLTEQGDFLDGLDTNEERSRGSVSMLDQLGRFLGS